MPFWLSADDIWLITKEKGLINEPKHERTLCIKQNMLLKPKRH